MRIITTHTNTDFDALASTVACTFLYPGSIGIIPSHVMPEVKAFLAIHQDLLRIEPRKNLDIDRVDSLIVVDTNKWSRLDRLEALSKKKDLEVICWDHHMEGDTLGASELHREEVGATITLLLEEMQRRDTAFTPMHATLFLLAIYTDTGCLCFSSTTARDARMVGFLLENGADLNIVSAYLDDAVDQAHSEVFAAMLDTSRIIEMDGMKVGLCLQRVQSGLTMLANLVTKYKEFKGVDVAVAIFASDLDKSMVIGRSSPSGVDIGHVMRELGGGGHAGAGSAAVKSMTPEAIEERVVDLIRDSSQDEVLVETIMSEPRSFTGESSMTMAEAQTLLLQRGVKALMICDGQHFLGCLSGPDCLKAEKKGRMETSVKGYIRRQVPQVTKDQNPRQALELMNRSDDGLLPVVEEGLLVGVLTRGNILLQIYTI